MNFKKLLKLFLLSLSIAFFSCSSDDSDNSATVPFDQNAQLVVNKVNATSAIFEVASGSDQNLKVGIRKKGTSEFVFESLNSTYRGLNPGTIYEAQLFVNNANDQSSFEQIEFITPILDFIKFANSETGSSQLYIKSVPGYEHKLVLGVDNQNFIGDFSNDFTLELVSLEDESSTRTIGYIINQDVLEFTMPVDILKNTNLPIDSYHLKYTINGNSYFFKNSQVNNLRYVISVFDPEPSFLKVLKIKRNQLNKCNGASSYNIRFLGSFLNILNFTGFTVHDKMNLVITRIDDGKELFLDFDSEDQSSCLGFKRLFGRVETDSKLSLIHTNEFLVLNYVESVEGSFRFTAGDYKIKANFSNDAGDFKTTKPFEFTISPHPFTNSWRLYKKVVDGVDLTTSALEECDFKEIIAFTKGERFLNRIFKNTNGDCSGSYIETAGTWVKTTSDKPGSEKYLTYLDSDTNKETPITFYYANDNIVIKVVSEKQLDGSIKEATYFYKS